MPEQPPDEGLQVEPDQEPPAAAQPAGPAAPETLRRGVRSTDPDTIAAARRIRAAKLCAASVYSCVGALGGYFLLGLLGTAGCGAIAVGCGALGLVGLNRAGPAPVDAAERPGLVRISARMAEAAPTKGIIGLMGGILLVVGSLGVLAAIVFAGRG